MGAFGRFDQGLAAGRRTSSRGDRVDVARPVSGSVYPSKGKGLGVQGEAAYPDLLDRWDRESRWQCWRKGMALACNQLVGAAERWAPIEALVRNPLSPTLEWYRRPVWLAGFTSSQSPEGRWTVAMTQRGSLITPQPVGARQREVWYSYPDEPDRPPLRLLEVNFRAAPLSIAGQQPLHFTRMLIGEILEDSAITHKNLTADPIDGLGLLCVAVHEDRGLIYFDATRCWRRELRRGGRLQLREHAIASSDPLPQFRPNRHLTQALTISCNCPSHTGIEFLSLQPTGRVGGQDLFPQRSPSGLSGPQRVKGEGTPEGVRRRFSPLPWSRIPGQECKHCHAVRWSLGVPLAESTDMPSPDSDYWRNLDVMAQLEEASGPMDSPQFVERLRSNLLDEQVFSMLDSTLLATCVGDCIGVVPQRVPLIAAQLGAGPTPLGSLGVLRFNEQHPTPDPAEDLDAVFGDWWVGRGTAFNIYGFEGPGKVNSEPAMRPIASPDRLPRLLP